MVSDFYGMDDIFKKEALGYLNECESVFESLRDELNDYQIEDLENYDYDKEKIKHIKNALFKIKKSSMMLDIGYLVDFISNIENKLLLILNDKLLFSANLLQTIEIAKSQIGYMIEFYVNNKSAQELEPKLQTIATNIKNKLEDLTKELKKDNNKDSKEESSTKEEQEEIKDYDKNEEEIVENEEQQEQQEQQEEQEEQEEQQIVLDEDISAEEDVGNDFFDGTNKTTPFANEFVISNIDEVKKSFIEKLEIDGDFVVDFSVVNSIDMAGVQLILSVKKYCDTEGVEFKINNPSEVLKNTFEQLNITIE